MPRLPDRFHLLNLSVAKNHFFVRQFKTAIARGTPMYKRSITLSNLGLVVLILLTAIQTGCGNRNTGGNSIAAELRKTLTIADPETRAKTLVQMASKQ